MANPAAEAVASGALSPFDFPDFKPSVARPFPGMRCIGIVKNGERTGEQCRGRAVYGAEVCLVHGAQLPVVRQKAERLVEESRMQLIGMLPMADQAMIDLLQPGTAEGVRLKAATEVYDRVGIRGGMELKVDIGDGVDPASALAERLAKLRERTVDTTAEEVVDGEVVPDPQPDEEKSSPDPVQNPDNPI